MPELEALLRSAAGYVKPSDDLRPRVLETARAARGDRRVCRRLRAMLFAALFSILSLDAVDSPLRQFVTEPREAGRIIDADDIYEFTKSRVVAGESGLGDDFNWGMVEAFNVLRAQQSRSLRPAM